MAGWRNRKLRRADGRAVTIPLHGGKEIGPPLFFKILRELGVSLEEFQELR
jgi:predicted RNA binding protein YcfA (HicA-like mRNA interferase family)